MPPHGGHDPAALYSHMLSVSTLRNAEGEVSGRVRTRILYEEDQIYEHTVVPAVLFRHFLNVVDVARQQSHIGLKLY